MSKGSIFRKWDLHVHTPASFESQYVLATTEQAKYPGGIWDKYIDELEKVKDISVVGICDYFTLDGYEKVLEYRNKGRLQNFDLILPNIEFRLDTLAGQRKINYHVIFSEEIPLDTLQREFVQQIPIRTGKGTERTLCRENIETIGRKLKAENKTFQDKPDYVVGCTNIEVCLEEIISLLEKRKDIFEGKYLLILPYSEWEQIPWGGQAHRIRQELCVKSHAFFTSNDNNIQWALGRGESYTHNKFIQEFGALKPCVHGSDAHCFEKLCKPDLDRYCWIKANATFEGLKQILYEPEERVFICKDNPEPRKNIYSFDHLSLNAIEINEDLSFPDMNVPINSGLVAIVGGKGTGKTAFIDLIANCFVDRCYRYNEANKDSNSFVQRIEDEAPNLSLELGFIGTDTQPFSKNLTDQTFFQDVKITYLPQSKIEEYSGSRQKLDQKIEEIIFANREVINSGYQEEYDRIGSEIKESNDSILKMNHELLTLEKKTETQVFQGINGELAIQQGKLSDNEAKIRELTAGMETSAKEKIETLKHEEEGVKSKLGDATLLSQKLSYLETNLQEFQNEKNAEIIEINDNLTQMELKSKIASIDFKLQLDSLKKATKEVEATSEKLTKEIKTYEDNIAKLSGVEKTHAELLTENEQIQNEIKRLKQQLGDLNKEKKKIQPLETKRYTTYVNLIDLYLSWKNNYAEVIKLFSQGKSDIMSGVDFYTYIHFDADRFTELGEDTLHMKKVTKDEIKTLSKLLEAIVSENDKNMRDSLIADYLTRINQYKASMKPSSDNYKFYNWVFGDYFSLSTHKKFNNTQIEKLSMGQKGTVLLKLFLAEGDYPLLIDQPEENLDNKFIFKELVKAFRQAKKNRQVIIATNNANLVVNTDAEQIIVADFTDGVISYNSGAIEDKKIREEITEILEGGPEAFKIREKKYNIELYQVEEPKAV